MSAESTIALPDDLGATPGGISRLLAIMARLREPITGCAWDLAQTFESLARYTVEEANEVVDAIARGDLLDLREELGDLLLQVVFNAQIARERGVFDFDDVVRGICEKLVRRHPHIFGDARDLSPAEVKLVWDQIKSEEKRERARERGLPADAETVSLLASVPAGLPPLQRAVRLQQRAASVGFDWPDIAPVVAKVREEVDEVAVLVAEDSVTTDAMRSEIGDLLFTVLNLARHADVDAEHALTIANAKFMRRFGFIEDALRETGRTPKQANLDEMDTLWDAAKAAEAT